MMIIIEKEIIQTIVARPKCKVLDQILNSEIGIDAPIIVWRIPLAKSKIPNFPIVVFE